MKRIPILVALALAPAASAQSVTDEGEIPLAKQVTACRAVSDRDARLDCYDAAATRLEQATLKGDIVILDRDQVRKTQHSLFGLALPNLPFFNDRKDAGGEVNEILGTVAGVTPGAYDRWTVTLEDGAVWRTTETIRGFRDPKVGNKVRIRKAALGSYMMTVDDGRAIKAQRIR